MTTLTDKELIKEIKERIGSLDVRDNIERRAYEIALASLEAEPVAWLHSDNGLGIPAITRSKNVADSWLSKGWYVQPLYIAKPVPVVPDARPSLNNGIVGFDEGWNACRAAMLYGAVPASKAYKLPQTQFKQVADLYEMQFDDGRTCAFHTDAQKAVQWLQACDGNRVQEYVKLERLQNALSGNSPVTPDGWISCSERMPEETGDIIVVSDGIVMSGISYSRRDGFYMAALEYDDDEPIDGVTHWMPLPEPPQEVNRG
ncbi:DUF551 domain-containing protein [Escherichia coli]